MNKSDVIIIGGGVIGLTTAYFLLKEGRSVTIIERLHSEETNSASQINCGMLAPSHFEPMASRGTLLQGFKWLGKPNSPLFIIPQFSIKFISWMLKFCKTSLLQIDQVEKSKTLVQLGLKSIALFKDICADIDMNLQASGLDVICNTEEAFSHEKQIIPQAQHLGLMLNELSVSDIKQTFPCQKNNNIIGGIHFQDDGNINPELLIQKLSSFLKNRGVKIHYSTKAERIIKANKSIKYVITSKGNFTADNYVIAAGVWTVDLTAQLSVRVPVIAGKGYSFMLDNEALQVTTPMILAEAKVAITPMGKQLRIGGTMELGDQSDGVNEQRVTAIREAILDYFPDFPLQLFKNIVPKYGFRPCSPDGLPIIGLSKKVNNLYISTGHGMLGLSHAPISGQIVSDLICKKKQSMNLAHVDPNRF